MNWKDIIKEDKIEKLFGREKRSQQRSDNVKAERKTGQIQKIKVFAQEAHDYYQSNPDFEEIGQFSVRFGNDTDGPPTPGRVTAKKTGNSFLMWVINLTVFQDIGAGLEFSVPHLVSAFEELGYNVNFRGVFGSSTQITVKK